MLTRAAALALTRAPHSRDTLAALARALGFGGPVAPLGASLRRALATEVPGGAPMALLRDRHHAALCLGDVPAEAWRRQVTRIVSILDRIADARRWLLVATLTDHTLVLAAWLSHPRGPQLAVLSIPPGQATDSDLQTLCALADAWTPDPTLTCLRWHDLLGRTAIGTRFFRALEGHVTRLADQWPASVRGDDRRTLALVQVARLLFLKFLEAKGWLDGHREFLAREVHASIRAGRPLASHLLHPLVFGTLNTPMARRASRARAFGRVPFLNGGLFAPTALERRTRDAAPPDEELARLVLDTLTRYRFTAREDTQHWSEAAIDPDMLGRAFEGLMHPDTRRGTGAFYTPAALVHTLVQDALESLTSDTPALAAALHATDEGPADPALLQRVDDWRILDPACGSGSMLVAALEAVTVLRGRLGDRRAAHLRRRDILCRSIFGIDRTPMAVWLCELRLWLAVVIDDPSAAASQVLPLPNLDHNIRVGDALLGPAFAAAPAGESQRIARLRQRYVRSSGARKVVALRALHEATRDHAIQRDQLRITALTSTRRARLELARQRTLFGARTGLGHGGRRELADLRRELRQLRARLRALRDGAAPPFDFTTHFPDAASAGGFDLVIGNPPWVRPHHLDPTTRTTLRTHLAPTTSRRPFGVQPDLAMAFTHRALALTRPAGTLAFVLPAKLWSTTAGASLRETLLRDTTLHTLRDCSHDAGGFAAAVYPSLLTLRRTAPMSSPPPDLRADASDATGQRHVWAMAATALPVSQEPGAPWRLVPPEVRAAADRLAHAGHPWQESPLPHPTLGVKTGCNEAFIVSRVAMPPALAPWTRPVLRGEAIRAWAVHEGDPGLVVPCNDRGMLGRLPTPLARHFRPHESALRARTDLRARDPWWTLFRTELLAPGHWRVVWADIGAHLRAAVLPPTSTLVPLNTCYGLRCTDAIDALALTALLNAPTTTAWLTLIAEPARGGYRRFMSWTVMQLPLPPWPEARRLLAPLCARARRGTAVPVEELHAATLAAYGLTSHSLQPLLTWTGHHLRTARTHAAHAS